MAIRANSVCCLTACIAILLGATASPARAQEQGPDTDPQDATTQAASDEAASDDNTTAQLFFRFRDQAWPEVLSWFADEADLSLVINSQPPNTFTYSDSRGYTPTEALDLLNSVLAAHRHTLIRRGRLLICEDVSNGAPLALVPQVAPEALDQFGQFEIVQVRLPLGKRPPDVVQKEITPVLGPLGTAEVLAQTRQLLVVGPANRVRDVQTLIASIPEPSPPAPREPKPKPPPATLQFYSTRDINVQAAVEVVEGLVGGVKLTVNEETGEIGAIATEAQHQTIRRVLDQMAQTHAQEIKPTLKIYDVEHESPQSLMSQLQIVMPDTTMALNGDPPRLFVFASAPRHELLQQTLAQLEVRERDQQALTPVIYQLKHVAPQDVATMVSTLFPRARTTVDPVGRQLVVIATPAQQVTIRSFVDQLDIVDEEVTMLRSYDIAGLDGQQLRSVVADQVPDARIEDSSDPERLIVIATAEDHERFAEWVAQLRASTPPRTPRVLRRYDWTKELVAQFRRLYRQLDPELDEVEIVDGQLPNEVLVVATAADHERIQAVVERLQTQLASEPPSLRFYDVSRELRTAFMRLKDSLDPDLAGLRWVEDEQLPGRLGAVATAKQHARITELLESVRQQLPTNDRTLRVFRVTPSQRTRFLAIQPSVETLRDVQIVDEVGDPRELAVWATPSQVEDMESVLASLDPHRDAPVEQQFVAYTMEEGEPQTVQQVLRELFPDVKVLVDEMAQRVMVWATPPQQQIIRSAVQQLDAPPRSGANRFAYYRLGDLDARDVEDLFRQQFPKMTLNSDRRTNSIIAWGNDQQHAALKAYVESLRANDSDNQRGVMSYPIGPRDPDDLRRLFRELAPRARLVVDGGRRAILAFASAEDHRAIAEALRAMAADDGFDDAALKSYPLRHTSFADVRAVLREIVPSAELVPSDDGRQLHVWTSTENHARIAQAMQVLDREDERQRDTVAQAYHARPEVLRQLQDLLTQLTPSARTTATQSADRVVIWALPTEHERIASVLESLIETNPEVARQFKTYSLRIATDVQARALIEEIAPAARFLSAGRPRELIVSASVEQHVVIGRALEELETALGQPEVEQVEVVQLGRLAPTTAMGLVDPELKQNVYAVPDAQRRAVILRGTAARLEPLKAALEQLARELPEPESPVSRVYPLQFADPVSLRATLVATFPTATINVDAETNRLVVAAMADVHDEIRATVEQLDQASTRRNHTRVYQVPARDVDQIAVALRQLTPQAIVVADSGGRRLFVTATNDDHERIAAALAEIQPTNVVTRVHELKVGDLGSARDVLRRLLPAATIEADSVNRVLLVTAGIEDQEAVAQVLSELGTGAGERTARVFAVPDADGNALVDAIRAIAPQASAAYDRRQDLLVVTATEPELAQVDTFLQQFAQHQGTNRVTRVHALPRGSLDAARDALRSMLPAATIEVDDENRSLLVTASPQGHQLVEQVLEDLQGQQASSRFVVYRLPTADVAAAADAVETLVPTVNVVVNEQDRLLMVFGADTDHGRVAQLVAELEQVVGGENLQTVAYRLRYADVRAASEALQSLLPAATLAADRINRTLFVTADDDDHARVKELLDEMDRTNLSETVTRVYRFRDGDVNAARDALAALLPEAVLAVDNENRALIVTGTEDEQRRVAQAVTDLDAPPTEDTVTRAYGVLHADVAAAQRLLQSLVPNAVVVADPANRTLAATASVAQHERIAMTLQQLDTPNPQAAQLQAYSVQRADARKVFETIRGMYDRVPDVRLSLDDVNRSIVVLGPPLVQRNVAQVVAQMENGVSGERDRSLVVYQSNAGDIASVQTALANLFRDQQPPVEIQVDQFSGQIIAIASPQQHQRLKAAIDQLDGQNAVVEVFPLQIVDPFAMELAIDELFGDQANAPSASGDSETQQLFVRGTAAQVEQIRQLLIQMGELPAGPNDQDANSRIIPFGGDVNAALRQLQQIWPRLRPNPMQVVEPPAVVPVQPGASGDDALDPSTPAGDHKPNVPPRNLLDDQSSVESDTPSERYFAHSHGSPQPSTASLPTAGQAPADTTPPAEPDSTPAPVVVIGGRGRISLFSEDPEALAQAEALLQTIARNSRNDGSAGNFAVFPLRHAGARNVAKILTELFEQMPITTRATLGRVSIVADDRLNALVVHGRPADRTVIRGLLEVLDSSNVPDSLANARPKIVQVNYLEVDDVLEILSGVYKSQLESGGRSRDVDIPEGIEPEMATLLRQINAASSGPLLTLEADKVTNSVIVLAPVDLSNEVSALISQLDKNARENDIRAVDILTLKGTNVRHIEDALRELLRDR